MVGYATLLATRAICLTICSERSSDTGKLQGRGRMRAIFFDFGGTLDGPSHWLDRFLAHYCASGLSLSRDELDSAYAYATRRAYEDSERLREYGLARLVQYLVGAQFDWLLEKGPLEVRGVLGSSGARKSQIAEQISRGFAGESARGLERSRKVLRTLESRNYSGRLRIRRGLDFSSLMSGFSKRRCASSQWRRVTP